MVPLPPPAPVDQQSKLTSPDPRGDETQIIDGPTPLRVYRHFVRTGVSFAIDIPASFRHFSRIAVVTCHIDDAFSRPTAVNLLNILLDCPDQTLHACRLTRNVFSVPYWGEKPKEDVLPALIEYLDDSLNERTLYRRLRWLFGKGIRCIADAQAASKKEKNHLIEKEFKSLAKILEASELTLLKKTKTLNEYDYRFFMWSGSADAIINGTGKFCGSAWDRWYEAKQAEYAEERALREKCIKDADKVEDKTSDKDSEKADEYLKMTSQEDDLDVTVEITEDDFVGKKLPALPARPPALPGLVSSINQASQEAGWPARDNLPVDDIVD